jgi:hypothetical protein
MYPTEELEELALRKTVLRARISADRLRCATFASEAARPIHLIDRVITQWKRIPPIAKIAAVPLGLLLRRAVSPRTKGNLVGRVMRFAPLVVNALKILKANRR